MMSLIHIVSFVAIYLSALLLLGANGIPNDNLGILSAVPNKPGYWACITAVLAAVSFCANPLLYGVFRESSFAITITRFTTRLDNMLLGLTIFAAAVSSFIFIGVALSMGVIYLSAHFILAIYYLLLILVYRSGSRIAV